MELKKYLGILNLNIKFILISCFTGVFIFLGIYSLTSDSFLVEGTIFVYPNQKGNLNFSDFNYSRNLVALSNSPEFKTKLGNQDLDFYEFAPLIGVVGGIKLREVSPNILSLSIKDNSQDVAVEKFKKYFLILEEFSAYLKKGNSDFEISLIEQNPIISRQSSNIFLYLMLGFTCGLFSSCFYLLFKKL